MIITLSRQLGSHGDVIAARVATALDLTLVDREYVHQAARAAGVPDQLLQKLMYEGQRSLASEIMDSLGGGVAEMKTVSRQAPPPLLGSFAPLLPPVAMSSEDAVQSVGLLIKDIASRDNILILGQGGQMWLHSYGNVCHVQIVAPFDLRVQRIAEREKLKPAQARRRVQACDAARADYLARYHDVRWLDPLLYHLVINTGYTSIDAAVSLIVHAAQAITPRGA